MASQSAKQTIRMHVLPHISRSKGNQVKKFSQLIEYNVRNTFLQKSYRERNREASFRHLFVF